MKKSLLLSFVLFGTLLTGCQQVNSDIAENIRRADKQYHEGNLVGADRLATLAIQGGPTSPAVAEAYYIRGLTKLKRRQFSTAELDFQHALNLAKRDDVKTNTYTCLAVIAADRGDWHRTYTYYHQATKSLPEVSPYDWVSYRLGIACQNTGRWDEAKKHFAGLIRKFPDSKPAELARKRLRYEYFTIQAGAFSRTSGAQSRISQLKKASLPARVKTETASKTLHVVYVGRYRDLNSAKTAFDKVKRVVPDATIVP